MNIVKTTAYSVERRAYSRNLSAKRYPLNAKIFLLTVFMFCALNLLSGCAKKDDLKQAQGYVQQSEEYYQSAVNIYKGLIAVGDDLERLTFELGQLYYNHGEYSLAIEEFKKSESKIAKKFLAISYYRMADFASALEVFNKQGYIDDESVYYQGLVCEKMNLFDQALEAYHKIKAKEFIHLASDRIGVIEKQINATQIKDLSPATYNVLNSAPDENQYPQAGALILFSDEDITISKENTQVTTLHYIIKILNERGKEEFAEAHINYDSTYEKVELEYARTIKSDGTVVDVGSRHIRDVSKYLNFPLYSNAHVYIISFPEIAEGSSIEYQVKIRRNQLLNKKDFVIDYPLQEAEPIIASNLRLSLPKDMPVRISNLNERYNDFQADLAPQKEDKDGQVVYSWHFKDIPQIIPETRMPSGVEINPTVIISSFKDWKEIYQWWWDLAKERVQADSAIKNKVNELIFGHNLVEEKIKSIYNFCAQKIRYVAVEYGQAGYQPHFAFDTYKNKYGDCKDKAILLITMLKEAGFNAYPVLISTREYYNLNVDFPAVLFNHCIAAVSIDDKLVFLDPTAETCAFGDLPVDDQNRKALVFKDDQYQIEQTPGYPPGHNLIKQSLNIKINSDESISGDKTVLTLGVYDQAQRYWLLYTPPELIQEQLQEKLQEVSIGAKLNDYHIKNIETLNNPVALDYAFSGREYLTLAGADRIMPLLSPLDTTLVARDERKYPIDFGAADTKEIALDYELPDDLAVKFMPESLSEESQWLDFSVDYGLKGNHIYFTQKIEFKQLKIAEDEYGKFKDFFENLARKVKQRIVLEKIDKNARKR